MAERKLNQPVAAAYVTAVLDAEWDRLARNPFRHHPLRRYGIDPVTVERGR